MFENPVYMFAVEGVIKRVENYSCETVYLQNITVGVVRDSNPWFQTQSWIYLTNEFQGVKMTVKDI